MTERQYPCARIGGSYYPAGTGRQLNPPRRRDAHIELDRSAEESRSLRKPVPVGPQPRSLCGRLAHCRGPVARQLCQVLGRCGTISLQQQVGLSRFAQRRGEPGALDQYVQPGLGEILR